MSTEERIEAGRLAMEKMRQGLQEFLAAIADDGEPEIALNALVLFEAQGMAPDGLFYRQEYLTLEQNGSKTNMLGMWELLKDRLDHDIRCGGGCDEDE